VRDGVTPFVASMPKRRPIDPEVAAVFSDRLGKAMKYSHAELWPRCKHREKKVTQDEVAAAVQVGQQLVGLWLKGSRLPRSDDLARICGLLRVSADWLLGILADPAERDHSGGPRAMEQQRTPQPKPLPPEQHREARKARRRVLTP